MSINVNARFESVNRESSDAKPRGLGTNETERALVDTNVLIYDTYEDSLYHARASRLLDELDKWVIPLIVLYEYIWFLKGMGEGPDVSLEKLEDYTLSEKSIVYREDDGMLRRALSSIERDGLSLSRFNDEVILTVAIREDLPLASFDGRLRSRAKRSGLIVMPPSI